MSKSNETIYEADFEAGKVKEIYANYHGDPYSFSTEYPLEEKLGKVMRLSKVPIRNVHDVYNALTDRETLNKVVEQGLDNEEYQRYRVELVSLFMRIKEKDKIKIEDLKERGIIKDTANAIEQTSVAARETIQMTREAAREAADIAPETTKTIKEAASKLKSLKKKTGQEEEAKEIARRRGMAKGTAGAAETSSEYEQGAAGTNK